MLIKTKMQSTKIIKDLDLNRVEEEIFSAKDLLRVKEFIKRTGFPKYGLRDKNSKGGGGTFHHGIKPEEVLDKMQDFKFFGLCESLAERDKENLVLQGEVLINKRAEIIASLNDIPGMSNREAMKNPKYKIIADLKERNLKIRGVNEVIDYIFEHGLFDFVVEFSLYNCPVGIKQERIVIWEIRNY